MITEALIQKAVIAWCRWHHNKTINMAYCINNDYASLDNPDHRIEACQKGLMPGASDICVPFTPQSLYLELKHNGNVQSDKQLKFQSDIEECGHLYVAVNSYHAAIGAISEVLTTKSQHQQQHKTS